MSIMCHTVKVLDWSTFRMNLTCTTPYNADFDGDEMNLHVLQTLPAIAEARSLMMPHQLLITPQSNRPVMGLVQVSFEAPHSVFAIVRGLLLWPVVQDALLGSSLMSSVDVFVDRGDMMALGTQTGRFWAQDLPPPAILMPLRDRPGNNLCDRCESVDLTLVV